MTVDRRRALVTGASRGVGAAVAGALSPSYELLLGGRDRQALAYQARSLPAATPWPVDLTDREALLDSVAGIDHLDVLVHSAGVWVPGAIGDMAPEIWQQVFAANVFAVAELTRLLLPALRRAGGIVVLINSTAGLRVSPRRGAYAASKFALRAFADVLRAEETSNGVRVTSIYPGRVATDMQRRVRQDEGGPFEPDAYLTADAVARAVLHAVESPPDAHLTEIVLAPGSQ